VPSVATISLPAELLRTQTPPAHSFPQSAAPSPPEPCKTNPAPGCDKPHPQPCPHRHPPPVAPTSPSYVLRKKRKTETPPNPAPRQSQTQSPAASRLKLCPDKTSCNHVTRDCQTSKSSGQSALFHSRQRVPHPCRAVYDRVGILTFGPPDCRRTQSRTVRRNFYAALPSTTCVQCAHRFASIGISLKHSGHFLVVGAAAGSSLFIRASSQFTGTTTKK